MSERTQIPGKFVWFELVSPDPTAHKKAQAFYAEVLGWNVQAVPMGNFTYEMILTGASLDTMIGGYATLRDPRQPSHWISYLSVEDVDAALSAVVANGGRVVGKPMDAPSVGRMARIADPQGAELCVFRSATGDPPDVTVAVRGGWLWNELHTSDPTQALAFYEKALGFSHRAMDMGPAGTYHIISRNGVDRGGVTGHLQPGAPPHWLPYVAVDDVDAAVARARKLGATIPMGAEDIPGVGRIGVLKDPTGAVLAIMKPLPRQE